MFSNKVISDAEDMGCTDANIFLKSDQEPAILEAQQKIMAARTAAL